MREKRCDFAFLFSFHHDCPTSSIAAIPDGKLNVRLCRFGKNWQVRSVSDLGLDFILDSNPESGDARTLRKFWELGTSMLARGMKLNWNRFPTAAEESCEKEAIDGVFEFHVRISVRKRRKQRLFTSVGVSEQFPSYASVFVLNYINELAPINSVCVRTFNLRLRPIAGAGG